jgi:phage-related tail fiber protein
MAVTNFSPLLGLALPTTGDLSGTWGTTVNDSITSLIDSSVAGTTTLSANTDVTLTTTTGAANQARNAIILWTASNGATTRNVTAPAQSKAYVVINAGTGSIVIRGSGPTTGVTVISGEKSLVAWNGSDFVKVSSTAITSLTGVLPIANGGTNASTASTALTNLGGITTGKSIAMALIFGF